MAVRERRCTRGTVGAGHAVSDAIDVRAAADSLLDRARHRTARVLQSDASAPSEDDAQLGAATGTARVRAAGALGSDDLPRSRHREMVSLLGIFERLSPLRHRAR